MKVTKRLCTITVLLPLALSLGGCGFDADPSQCGAISEAKGQAIARKSIIRFLRYAGTTHAPISGDGGALDAAKLEQVSDGDLVYDSRSPTDNYTYQFHLRWAPNAVFAGTVAANCAVTTNWAVNPVGAGH
jgi:hypothetical protein